jgi:ubiquinone biosynthesis protein UbiJ
VGNLAQRMAELTLLREQVRRLEQRVQALENG